MTPEQVCKLPESFRHIVEIDRRLVDPVVSIKTLRERRYWRRMAEIACRAPTGSKAASL